MDHSTILAGLGVDADDIATMRKGEEPSGERAAVHTFARALVLDRGAIDGAIVERALAAGLTPADLLEVVTECVFASLVGIVDNLAGRVPLDEFLRSQAWP